MVGYEKSEGGKFFFESTLNFPQDTVRRGGRRYGLRGREGGLGEGGRTGTFSVRREFIWEV